MVEQSAVNRSVAGSNPACGAIRRAVRVGRRSMIGNHVGRYRGLKGSNPLLSARFLLYNQVDCWPLGQVVKTPPFHGGNTGSNPVGVIIETSSSFIRRTSINSWKSTDEVFYTNE